MRARRSKSGFTLIEILIVVAIIAVLATVLLGVVLATMGRGDTALARNFVNNVVSEAISTWQQDNGHSSNQYPPSPNMRPGGAYTEGNAELFAALILEPERSNRAPYIGEDHYARGVDAAGRPVFVDPWGNPYIYRNYSTPRLRNATAPPYQGRRIASTYDLISMGPDGTYETEDDIYRGGQ
jgi:prepilin-type N-terminal cleavage/methylation domain-containing protein